MKTPYNTGRVKIGIHYQPPVRAWTPSRTELMLQEALIAKPTESPVDTIVCWVLVAGFFVALYFGVTT